VLAVALSALVTAVSLLLIPFRGPVADLFGRTEVAPLLVLIPAGVLIATWSRIAELWLTRSQEFRSIAVARAAQSGIAIPIQVVAGILAMGAFGLAGGYLAGRTAALVGMARSAVRDARFRATRGLLTRQDLRRVAQRFRRFPAFSMPSGFLNNLSIQLPAFLLLAFFAPEVAGLYAIAHGTLAVPMQLLGSSVAQVFFSHAADAHRRGTLGSMTSAVHARLSAIGLFPLAAVAIAGPAAFALVFGAEWREAGVYAQYLAPWVFFVFLSSPLSNLFDVLDRQHRELQFNVALTVSRLAALLAGAAIGSPRWSVALFAAVSAIFWIGHTVWMLHWGGAKVGRAMKMTARHAMLAAPPLVLLLIAVLAGWGDAAVVGVLVICAILAYGILLRFEPELLPRPS
jgi:O-antigen/teichoic acid export membrane protein